MPMWGYGRRVADAESGLLQMREVRFDLPPAELRSVAAFLLACADRIEGGRWRSDHAHAPESPPGVDLIVLHPPTGEAGRPMAEVVPRVRPGDVLELTLERGPCFGTCPVFRFTAISQGRYVYEGRSDVEPLGARAGAFPGYLFARLAEACVDLRVPELDARYESDFEDAPSVCVEVRHAGGLHVVRNDGGDSGPARLWAFAALVEVAMRQTFEIEARQAGRGG